MQQTISKSPLFTMNNIHYLCSESKELLFLLDYQFEESTPENISDNLPIEIQNQIREQRSISDYYLYDIIPDLFQNLAALQDINQFLELADIISLIKEIDKFSKESISSMILF